MTTTRQLSSREKVRNARGRGLRLDEQLGSKRITLIAATMTVRSL
jgi:hypothetical protein